MQRFAIIGFGYAGFSALKAIRDAGCGAEIDVYSETKLPPYNPMLTTYYIAGKLDYKAMFPFGSLEEIASAYSARILTQTKACRIEDAKSVTTQSGGTKPYDKILIATGASAFVPPTLRHLLPEVHCMRTVDDAERLKYALQTKKMNDALVVGASMVGIKVAELLNDAGVDVTLTDLCNSIFPLAAYPDVAEIIEKHVQERGIRLKLGCVIENAKKTPEGYSVSFSTGECIHTDALVLNIGTRAATEALSPAIAVNRGIVVNERMETSVPDIYAAGDCCEGNNLQTSGTQIIGLWANAGLQGRVAGQNMAGKYAEMDGSIPCNITHFMDLDFISIGDNRESGETRRYVDPEKRFFIEAIRRDGKLVGFNILNHRDISGVCKAYFTARLRIKRPLPAIQKAVLEEAELKGSFIRWLEEETE